MSGSSRVTRKRQERRNKIIEAASALIAEQGAADFSMHQLAKDLDYTPGALYWYFPSKEAVVVAVQIHAFEALAVELRELRVASASQPFAQSLPAPQRPLFTTLRFADYYLSLIIHRPEWIRLISFSLDPRVWLSEEEAPKLAPVLMQLFAEVAQPISDAMSSGALSQGNPGYRAVQFWLAVHGPLQTAKLARLGTGLFSPRELGIDSAATLLRGWGADPRIVDAICQEIEAPSCY